MLSVVRSGLTEGGRPRPHGTCFFASVFDALAFETAKDEICCCRVNSRVQRAGTPALRKTVDLPTSQLLSSQQSREIRCYVFSEADIPAALEI